jgi:SAM-dependent methyltransferase
LAQANLAAIDDPSLTEYYRTAYREIVGIAHAKDAGQSPYLRARGAALASLLKRHAGVRPIRQVFEVGAGYGVNLVAMGTAFPAAELLTDEIDETIERPVGIKHAALSDGPFDAIVMSHVLEHFKDPVGALKRAVAALAEGGLLVIEVPNDRADVVGYLGFDEPHLTFFDERTLQAIAARVSGLKMLEVFTAGPLRRPRSIRSKVVPPLRKFVGDVASHLPLLRGKMIARRSRTLDFTTPVADGIFLRAIFLRVT